jgi:TldD protein
MDITRFDTGLLQSAIARALSRGGDFAEVFVEDRETLGLRLEDGRIEQASGGRELGAAVRLLAIARKAELLRAGDEAARAAGAEVVQAIVGYADTRQQVLIANSLGDLVRDDRTRTRFTTQVVAHRGDVIQTGHETLGGSAGFELVDEAAAARVASAAAVKALSMLDARPAPVGAMPVVLANGFGGTLFHEACGHGLEADAVAKGASIYAGKMGEDVAAPLVSAYDDGALANGWGSQAFDDEGVPTQKTLLIEEGRLTGYLYDRLRAREAGACPTGNGRRQSFRHVPIPRMTTTYIAPGDADPKDIIAATDHGFYAKSLAGGQVEPASGNFVFGVAEGYLIEGGRITSPLRGATLIGNGIDILMKIDMIAADFDVKSGICGKDGQGVPVGTGQATLRISEMTVGGTG